MDQDSLYTLEAVINQGMAALMKAQEAPAYFDENM